MDKQDIKKLFPLKAFITQEVLNTKDSIGERCLLNALPKELHDELFWGLSIGHVGGVLIGVYQNIVYTVLKPMHRHRHRRRRKQQQNCHY